MARGADLSLRTRGRRGFVLPHRVQHRWVPDLRPRRPHLVPGPGVWELQTQPPPLCWAGGEPRPRPCGISYLGHQMGTRAVAVCPVPCCPRWQCSQKGLELFPTRFGGGGCSFSVPAVTHSSPAQFPSPPALPGGSSFVLGLSWAAVPHSSQAPHAAPGALLGHHRGEACRVPSHTCARFHRAETARRRLAARGRRSCTRLARPHRDAQRKVPGGASSSLSQPLSLTKDSGRPFPRASGSAPCPLAVPRPPTFSPGLSPQPVSFLLSVGTSGIGASMCLMSPPCTHFYCKSLPVTKPPSLVPSYYVPCPRERQGRGRQQVSVMTS